MQEVFSIDIFTSLSFSEAIFQRDQFVHDCESILINEHAKMTHLPHHTNHTACTSLLHILIWWIMCRKSAITNLSQPKKSARIRSFSGLHFPIFGLNMEIYSKLTIKTSFFIINFEQISVFSLNAGKYRRE